MKSSHSDKMKERESVYVCLEQLVPGNVSHRVGLSNLFLSVCVCASQKLTKPECFQALGLETLSSLNLETGQISIPHTHTHTHTHTHLTNIRAHHPI